MPGGFPFLGDLCNAQSINVSLSNSYDTAAANPTSGATANTKGFWVSIGTTTYDSTWARINRVLSSGTVNNWGVAIDIGVGTTGNQFPIVNNLLIPSNGQFQTYITPLTLPLSIPAGTNIWVRSQCNVGSCTDRASVTLALFDGGFAQSEGGCGVDSIGFVSTAPTATVTTPVASPGVVNWTSHGLQIGQMVSFSGGTLPTGITSGTYYFIIAGGFGTNAFEIATSVGGTAINFTGTSSGTRTGVSIGTCGTAITPGNGAKSSYVQLTAATPKDYTGIFGMVDTAGNSGGLSAIDIAIGSAGNEVVIIPNQIAYFGTCGITSPRTHRTAMFECAESRKAFNEIRGALLVNIPPGCLDRAAFQLIDRGPGKIDQAISAMCETAEAQISATNPALSASLAFSIPFVAGVMIRERLREIEDNRGYA
jgi:hypothetical protein